MTDRPLDLLKDIGRDLPPSLALNYLALRRALGAIGLCLPLGIMAFYLLDPSEVELRTSLSAYYYSGMRDFFVGSLLAIGIFLVTYRGNHDKETRLSTWAGVGAILVALCPTDRRCIDPDRHDNLFFAQDCSAPIADPVDYFFWPEALFGTASTIHYLAAALFFINVARLSYYVFVETSDTAEKLPRGHGWLSPDEKQQRNRRYRNYGRIIAACIVLMGLDYVLNEFFGFDTDPWKPIFWIEVAAVWTFAIAWLEKGEALAAPLNFLVAPGGADTQKRM